MSPVRSFFLSIFLFEQRSLSHSLEPLITTTLTATNPFSHEAHVIIESSSEVTESDSWMINVSEMDTWHLKAQLNNSWGFHPTATSSITITIDSPSIPGSTLDDILIAFTVPNSNEFTAVRLYMENIGSSYEPDIVSRISPSCDSSSSPSQHLNDGDLDTILKGHYSRKCSLGVSTWSSWSCASTDNHSGMQPPGQSNSFPLTFTLLNIPNDSGYLIYEGAIVQSCGFANGFAVDNGLDVHFALGSYGDSAEINSFQFTYSQNSTLSPTIHPTTFPTTIPTAKPTSEPTLRSLSKSGEIDDSLSSTADMEWIPFQITTDHSQFISWWSQWLDGPYFIPSAFGLGAVIYTLCMVMVCCCWRRRRKTNKTKEIEMHHHISETSIVPHHSVHSTMSNVSDARSMMSTYSNVSPRETDDRILSAQSVSGHFDPPMLFTTNSGIMAPPLIDVNEQVM